LNSTLTDLNRPLHLNCYAEGVTSTPSAICHKKGIIHLIVPLNRFKLLQGEDCLSTYTFNTGTAKHHFCRICGIHSFYRPRSHPEGYDVNVRCLDGNAIEQFNITPFDGAHWEQDIDRLRDRYS
jgi:hypothetical protein